MGSLEEIRQLYADYLERVRQAEQSRKPLEGYLGFGRRLGTDPCHNEFAQALDALLLEIDQGAPASAAVREMLEYIYRAPQAHQKPLAVYWMLIAVHGPTIRLIDRLDREDAQALWTEYKALYQRGDRLPVQKKVLAALKKACGHEGIARLKG